MKRFALIAAAIVGTVLFYAGTASGGIHPAWTCAPDDYLESECGPTTVAYTTTTSVVINTVVAPTTTTTEVPTSTTTTSPSVTSTTTAPTSSLPSTTTSSTSTSVAPTTTTSSPPSTTTTTAPTSSTSSTLPVPSSTTSTSTPPSSTTSSTSTLPNTFTFGAAGTVCVREVPTIRITFQNLFPSLAGRTGTLTMTSAATGEVVDVQSLVYEPGTTVDILYPGTSVDSSGLVTDVPGWNLNSDGFWVQDPSDAFLRQGIFLTYEVNPTAGPVLVSYPPESSGCANPSGPFPPPRLVPGQLPPTA